MYCRSERMYSSRSFSDFCSPTIESWSSFFDAACRSEGTLVSGVSLLPAAVGWLVGGVSPPLEVKKWRRRKEKPGVK